MPQLNLVLSSERFPPSGGIEAGGVKRLLGAPNLPLLHTVIREAGQNSCDAGTGDGPVELVVRLRTLTNDQVSTLREQIFSQQPDNCAPLRAFLENPAPVVMEISDRGTRGLGGPTRADEAPCEGEPADFVNFIRNVGAVRDVHHGGGTYGYGKSSLYLASRCSTILVDTLARKRSGTERRFIACHLGDAYRDSNGKLTGRHWWGAPSEILGFVEPIVGQEAEQMARSIGMPERHHGETGTTITVLDPLLPSDDLEECLGEIQEVLLWYFWPRMLPDGRKPQLVCAVEREGLRTSIPAPEEFPPLDLFVEAYRTLKANGPGTKIVYSERPSQRLGGLCVRRGFRNARKPVSLRERSIIPHASAHIALMRPVGLVVRYYEGTPLPNDLQEWAGLFICDESEEVESAFAQAEPPAHDNWDPGMLPRGSAKTFVNVALREIRKVAGSYALPTTQRSYDADSQPSLARASSMLGNLISVQESVAARKNGTRGNSKRYSVGEPSFFELCEGVDGAEAVFRLSVVNPSGAELRLCARPGLILDGAISAEQQGPRGDIARVVGWETASGQSAGAGAVLNLHSGEQGEFRVRVTVPDLSAVGVEVIAEELGDK